jgi:hypothetical protein
MTTEKESTRAMAHALNDATLADRILRLSHNVRWCSRLERDAYLIEAARRLDPKLREGRSGALDTTTTDC